MFPTLVCLGKVRRRGYLAQNMMARLIEESLIRALCALWSFLLGITWRQDTTGKYCQPG
jgi:hypothetical protein